MRDRAEALLAEAQSTAEPSGLSPTQAELLEELGYIELAPGAGGAESGTPPPEGR